MRAILLGILMFMVLVIIHELGHFVAAKKTGVKVLEFGIGIPPKAFRRRQDSSGTEYTINWLPLGGFVRLKGENPDDADTFLAEDSFVTAKLWKKIVILFAGVFVNFVAAWLCFSVAFMHGVTPINVIPDNAIQGESTSYLMPTYTFLQSSGMLNGDEEVLPAAIRGVASDSVAAKIGIEQDDVIVRVDGKEVTNYTLSEELGNYFGKTFSVDVLRGDKEITYQATCPEDFCVLGVSIDMGEGQQLQPITFSGIDAFRAGRNEMIAETRLTFMILGSLVKNLTSFDATKMKESVNKLSGPVGIVKVGEAIYQGQGIWMYIAFAGMISLALAVFNILPIPALDGGRALGVLIQEIAGLKPEKYFVIENYFNILFFVLLMGLGIYIILLDLVRFWGVSIPGLG